MLLSEKRQPDKFSIIQKLVNNLKTAVLILSDLVEM